MRSKAPLALMEQVIMLLVFALAAVLCLNVFVWADARSAESAQRDRALVEAQSAAEVLKSCCGDFAAAADLWGGSRETAAWCIRFDADWQQTEEKGVYLLRVTREESGLAYLGLARVEVYREETRLASLNVAWQEVGGDG